MCCSKAAATDALLFFLSPPKISAGTHLLQLSRPALVSFSIDSLPPSNPPHRRVATTREGTLIRHTGGPPPLTWSMLPLDPPHGRAIAASDPWHTDDPYSGNPPPRHGCDLLVLWFWFACLSLLFLCFVCNVDFDDYDYEDGLLVGYVPRMQAREGPPPPCAGGRRLAQWIWRCEDRRPAQ
jgi:hypothetical protein